MCRFLQLYLTSYQLLISFRKYSMPAYTSLRKHKKCVIKFSFVVLLQLSSLIYYHPGVPCRLCTVDAHLLLSPQLRGEWRLCQKPFLLLYHLVRKLLAANRGVPSHAFVSSYKKANSTSHGLLDAQKHLCVTPLTTRPSMHSSWHNTCEYSVHAMKY